MTLDDYFDMVESLSKERASDERTGAIDIGFRATLLAREFAKNGELTPKLCRTLAEIAVP